jgi:peptide/nickel transport system substrate-binding protein
MKLKRILVFVLFPVLLFSAPSVLAQAPTHGGTLRVAISTSLNSLDWMSYTQTIVRQVCYHIWETLITFDENFTIIGQLAHDWKVSPDYKTYTFYLRKGVQFHKGYGEMKAEDVKSSIDRYIQKASSGAALGVKAVEVIDDYTVALHLKESRGPAFLSLLALPSEAVVVFPKEIMDPMPGVNDIGIKEAVGTGPFELTEWIPGEKIVLSRFEAYSPPDYPEATGLGGKRVAYLDKVILIPTPEPSARISALEAGDVDFADEVPLSSYPRLKGKAGIKTYPVAPYYIPQAYFNLAKGVFSNNIDLRRAVLAAVDTEQLLQAATRGFKEFYKVDCGSLFYQDFQSHLYSDYGCEHGFYGKGAQLDKARELMQKAGYKGEKIVIITNTDYYYMYAAALALADQMGRAGFNTKMEVYDWPGELDRRANLEAWDIAFSGYMSYHWLYDKKNWTYFREYEWPEMRALVEQDLAALTQEERLKVWEKIMKLFIDEATMINIGEVMTLYASSGKVHYPNWYIWSFWNTWMEK